MKKQSRNTVQRWRGLQGRCIGLLGSKRNCQFSGRSLVEELNCNKGPDSVLVYPVAMASVRCRPGRWGLGCGYDKAESAVQMARPLVDSMTYLIFE